MNIFTTLVQLSPDIITIIDEQGKVLFKSAAANSIHGYSIEEILSHNALEFIHPEDCMLILDTINELKKNPNKTFTVQYRQRSKDGSYKWMEANAVNLLENPHIKGIVTFARDITERKKIEQELKQNHEDLRTLLNSFPEYYILFDADGKIIEANPKFSIKGFIPIHHKKLEDCIPILEFQKIKNLCKKHYLKDSEYSFEIEYLEQYFEITVIPFKNHQTICIIKDFTPMYKTIKAIESSEARYKSLFFNAPNGIAQLSKNFYFEQVNPALCKLLGYEAHEIIGKSLFHFTQENKDDLFKEFINQFLSSHAPFEVDLSFLNKSGEEIFVNLKINTISDTVGITQYLLAYFVDITEIKRNQKLMQESIKEKESLIKEIHHRVKNNLQVISSLLSLQMNLLKNNESYEKFKITQARVHSIALLHDQLYKSNNFNQVIMENYIQILTNNLIHFCNKPKHLVQVNYQLKDFILDIEQASPIAIILNELISNALRHAVTNDEMLQIFIQYQYQENFKKIVIKDNGVGLPQDFDIKKVKSLGLSLVNILTKQINGKLHYHYENGAIFELIF